MIIGITGSFGTGKTTVANIFGKYGFEVINVDKLYRRISRPNTFIYNKIKKQFGNNIIKKNKSIDRNTLKKIVFNDYKKLEKLNKITHPLIIKELKKEISTIINKPNKKYLMNKKGIKNKIIKNMVRKYSNGKIINKIVKINEKNIGKTNKIKIVVDAPLLIEAKARSLVDKLIVVKCNRKEQIKRALKKKKYTKREIENIIKSQIPLKEKIKHADFIIDNNGTIKETERQVRKIIASLAL